MEETGYWLQTFLDLGVLFGTFLIAVAIQVAAISLYIWVTPYDEVKLIAEGNIAAGIALMGASLSIALPLAAALANTAGLVGLLFWGGAAVIVQLAVFLAAARVYPELPKAIAAGEIAGALKLSAAHVSVAILNAAAIAG